LQAHFQNPYPLLSSNEKWLDFMASATLVLDAFKSESNDSSSDAPQFFPEEEAFNPKYLTSSKLLQLEVKLSIFYLFLHMQ
jgi:hypothetical protein